MLKVDELDTQAEARAGLPAVTYGTASRSCYATTSNACFRHLNQTGIPGANDRRSESDATWLHGWEPQMQQGSLDAECQDLADMPPPGGMSRIWWNASTWTTKNAFLV